jgi:hypothetical protein
MARAAQAESKLVQLYPGATGLGGTARVARCAGPVYHASIIDGIRVPVGAQSRTQPPRGILDACPRPLADVHVFSSSNTASIRHLKSVGGNHRHLALYCLLYIWRCGRFSKGRTMHSRSWATRAPDQSGSQTMQFGFAKLQSPLYWCGPLSQFLLLKQCMMFSVNTAQCRSTVGHITRPILPLAIYAAIRPMRLHADRGSSIGATSGKYASRTATPEETESTAINTLALRKTCEYACIIWLETS